MAEKLVNKNRLAYFWGKITSALAGKQATLVSGTNIKTVNSTTLLGSGNLSVGTITKVQANGTDVVSSGTANIPAASTTKYGVTQLSSSTSSSSTALAATPSAVKSAYDLAASKGVGNILYGTSAPTSSTGANGDIYVVYSS